ncbi:integrase [Corticimicrobacter populi]|uniref:Integrase n=1 Tax=Corticimicrobacter populi TaxID=2175229 RepID=A0A2V1K3A1_9BURK|nr:integrase [Corticimicrobacter populi]
MNFFARRQNQPRRKPCPTLADALDRYMQDVSRLKKGGVQEASIARCWKSTFLSCRTLANIRHTDLKRLRDEWLETRKPATVVRRLALLSHLYTVARKEWGYTTLANPAQLVSRPSVDDARDRRLFERIKLRGIPAEQCPRHEIEWIMRATRSAELPTILTLAVETCMRRSEIVGILRQDVDLLHGVVRLRDTKNGMPRDVPLTPLAREALRQWLSGRPMRGPIFTMRPGSVTRAFIRARDRARRQYEVLCKTLGRRPQPHYFADLRFHDLRHEGTSRLATVFGSHELAKITGHHDTRMLLRYYHPRGWELARKLARSPLGRRQSAAIQAGAAMPTGISGRPAASGKSDEAGQSRRAWM